MLDARTMAVRRKLHNVIGRRWYGVMSAVKMHKEWVEVDGVDVEVLRPVRNRRWQF
jgi:hypothetical protein